MKSLALGLALVAVTTSVQAQSVDGGAPPDAAPAPASAPPTPPSPPAPPPAKAAAAPAAALATPPADGAPRSRPAAIHRSALFWTSIVLGACAVVAIGVGAGLAASYHARYASVTF